MKEEKSNTQSNSDNNRNANKNKNIKKGMILEKKKESYESRLNRQGFRVSGDLLRIASSGGIRVILVVVRRGTQQCCHRWLSIGCVHGSSVTSHDSICSRRRFPLLHSIPYTHYYFSARLVPSPSIACSG